MCEIDKEVILKLFELSIHRYSEVSGILSIENSNLNNSQIRCAAQTELFHLLKCYRFSYVVIVDRIVELFNKPDTVHHDQIKVCHLFLLCLFILKHHLGMSLHCSG